eukprot:TRINITY_DN122163_c0_g1_i1.p1 TRINITY_DN122163_c0_g1~~TRINITY_DN122163_c0_g1_i1.p1  ORF type:complete len:502 (+),score=164.92 TRINITY_DN122163_c0_g1_i1:123-1628(+)
MVLGAVLDEEDASSPKGAGSPKAGPTAAELERIKAAARAKSAPSRKVKLIDKNSIPRVKLGEEEGDVKPTEPPEAIIAMLQQCSSMGLIARQKQQVHQAVTHLQRAVAIAKKGGREFSHPRVALEAARIRLNLSSVLSRAGRHMEAIETIKEAQQSLAGILGWAASCETEEPAVLVLAEEARMLQCAANVAEAIELEPFDEEAAPAGRDFYSERARQAAAVTKTKALQQERYSEAMQLADEVLPEGHAITRLAEMFSHGQSSSAGSAPVASPVSSAPRKMTGSSSAPNLAGGKNRAPPARAGLAIQRPDSGGDAGSRSAGTPDGAAKRPPARNLDQDANVPVERKGRGDPFGDFLSDIEYQKQLRLGSFQDWKQEETRKNFYQKTRITKSELKAVEELEASKPYDNIYELKYTRPVHAMWMMGMTRVNFSRSDYDVIKEARKYNDPPETIMLRRLGCKLAGVEAMNPKDPRARRKRDGARKTATDSHSGNWGSFASAPTMG